MTSHLPLFTLVPRRAYAMQFLGEEFRADDSMSYSPIRVHSVNAMKTGGDLLKLDFFHANYPEGVQDKEYLLRVRVRDSTFVFATRVGDGPPRHLLITELTWSWLTKHFGIRPSGTDDDVQSAPLAGR